MLFQSGLFNTAEHVNHRPCRAYSPVKKKLELYLLEKRLGNQGFPLRGISYKM
jgi:hypothetical protein